MKTNLKIGRIAIAMMAIVSSFCIISCEKENLNQSNPSSPDRLKAILQKTNGGKQAVGVREHQVTDGYRSANSVVFPPLAELNDQTNDEWSADWWTWACELPATANHPLNDDPGYDVTMGQSGPVWYLGTPFGTVTRTCTIPAGKPLFIGTLNFEASDLEGYGATYAERLATADFFADHAVPASLYMTVDGVSVNLSAYRTVSPEFNFNAPSPWYFGTTGGYATAVSDGYFVMVKPFNSGSHVINYGGSFHFSVAAGDGFDFDASADVTYYITAQ